MLARMRTMAERAEVDKVVDERGPEVREDSRQGKGQAEHVADKEGAEGGVVFLREFVVVRDMRRR